MEEELKPEVSPSPKPVKDPTGSALLEWDAWEYEPRERSSDWYWVMGAVALASIVLLIFFKNFLLALIIALATFSLFIHERRGPQMVKIKITNKGIVVDTNLFLYNTIRSFWIEEDFEPDHLIIYSEKAILPRVEVSLESANTEQVRAILTNYLTEQEEERGFIENLTKLFGF